MWSQCSAEPIPIMAEQALLGKVTWEEKWEVMETNVAMWLVAPISMIQWFKASFCAVKEE